MLAAWAHYGRLVLGTAAVVAVLLFDGLLIRPVSFVSGVAQADLAQWLQAALVVLITLLAVRAVKREVIDGAMRRRAGAAVPQLVSDVVSIAILFVGLCVVLAVVFRRDITGFMAAGGAGIMVLGIALRDMLLAAFTGIVLNMEKPFKPGDTIRVADKFQGRVQRITWRSTVLVTAARETVVVPNILLSNAILVNLDGPNGRARRVLQVVIDYDTSVESAERILYAAALSSGVELAAPPVVSARRLDPEGVVYEISFLIVAFRNWKRCEHEMIRSVLRCLRDARITVSLPKTENISDRAAAGIADRALDSSHLVRACRVFRDLPLATCGRIAEALVEHAIRKGEVVVEAGEARHSLFIVGEGMARRTATTPCGSSPRGDAFIATEAFGRRALFCLDLHPATVVAETDVLIYELTRDGLLGIFAEDPGLKRRMAAILAKSSLPPRDADDPAARERMERLYEGQIEAAYGARALGPAGRAGPGLPARERGARGPGATNAPG